jgi:hypothetical protein
MAKFPAGKGVYSIYRSQTASTFYGFAQGSSFCMSENVVNMTFRSSAFAPIIIPGGKLTPQDKEWKQWQIHRARH